MGSKMELEFNDLVVDYAFLRSSHAKRPIYV